MSIIQIPDNEVPWYKSLYGTITMYLKWNCVLTRWIYSWYFKRFCKDFSKFTFPIIKNMDNIPTTKDLITIQPMDEPPGTVFYLDYVYAKKAKWWKFWKK